MIATDPGSDKAFPRYWFVIRPAAAAMRREVLRVTARHADARADSDAAPGTAS